MAEFARHVSQVIETATDPGAAARSRLAASWRRSLDFHGLDPARADRVHRIEHSELVQRWDGAAQLLSIAGPKIDALHQLVNASGCGVLLTDADGVVLDMRAADGDLDVFQHWGLAPGADWSEASEGTNGIGTCIAEKREVTVHRGEHFNARNIAMSCMDAPIFGPDGQLIGALDVSSARADQTKDINKLIAAMVGQTAKHIEADVFRATYPKARIVVTDAKDGGTASLLAVDADDIVIGATRSARRLFGFNDTGPIAQKPAVDVLGRDDRQQGFDKAERAAIRRALSRAGGNVSQAARALTISRATLYRRMKRLQIEEDS